MAGAAQASPDQDRAEVAALDTEYQAAVERNDAEAMARILHPDMILVVGRGAVFTREDLLRSARVSATSSTSTKSRTRARRRCGSTATTRRS